MLLPRPRDCISWRCYIQKVDVRILVLAPMFAALTAAGALVKLPLGEVPMTFQTMMVYLSGLVLGSFGGCLSQLLYLMLGLIGIPVFAFGGGPAYFLNPTFGYLVAFVPAAFISGLFAEKGGYIWPTTGVIFSIFVVYIIGVPYFYFIMKFIYCKDIRFTNIMTGGLVILIIIDFVKAITAMGVFFTTRKSLSLPLNKGGDYGRTYHAL